MSETLGGRIERLIRENNLSQKDFAKDVGTTESAICRYLKDERIPRIDILCNMATALGVSLDYLVTGKETKVALNLIEKLQKENKELKNESKSKQKAYDDCYCEYKHYKQYDSIPKDKIKELIKKLEKAEKDIKIDAGAFELPKADALTMFRLNILAGYASSVELLRILLEED